MQRLGQIVALTATLTGLTFLSNSFADPIVNPFSQFGELQLCPDAIETDGSPNVACPSRIEFPNGSLTQSGANAQVSFTGGGAAANSEPFVTIGNTSGLSAERALTEGTGIDIADGGANSTATVNFDSTEIGNVSWNTSGSTLWQWPSTLTMRANSSGSVTLQANGSTANYIFSGAGATFDKKLTITSSAGATTPSLTLKNITDNASVQITDFKGADRVTPTNNDEIYQTFQIEDSSNLYAEFARLSIIATDTSDVSKDGAVSFDVQVNNVLTEMFRVNSSGISTTGNLDVDGTFTQGSTGQFSLSSAGALTADWDAGSFEIRAQTFESDVATGTAPFVVASTTKVTNLNADTLDGIDSTGFARILRGTFANADLSAGVLTITHNYALASPYQIHVTIYDNNSKEIIPDENTGATNSVAVTLTSYGTLTGTWGYVVMG